MFEHGNGRHNPAAGPVAGAPIWMKVIGLTGGVGTGKSTVARMFQELGAVVLDADRVAHALMRPGTDLFRKIRARFGKEVLTAGRKISRRKLGKCVFRDGRELKALCRIVHPAVRRQILARLKEIFHHRPEAVAVLEIPLLFEAESAPYPTDAVVVVVAPRTVTAQRLKARRGWSPSELNRRIRFQYPLHEKAKRADFVVDNGGTKAETRRQVLRVWRKMTGEGIYDRRKDG